MPGVFLSDCVVVNTDELIDIELPVAPGFDWESMLGSLGMVLFSLLLLLAIWRLLPFIFSSLMLHFKLNKLYKQSAEQAVSLTANQLFVWLRSAAHTDLLSPEAVQGYQVKIDQACFSKERLPPEEIMGILESLQQEFRIKMILLKALSNTSYHINKVLNLLRSKVKNLFLNKSSSSQNTTGKKDA